MNVVDNRLIDSLNSGKCWAFVGAGISVSCGYPSWESLLDRVCIDFNMQDPEAIAQVQNYKKNGDYSQAFSVLERIYTRIRLEEAVRLYVSQAQSPSPLSKLIATFPLEGIVTTNFDSNLERVLPSHWVAVGNSLSETRKVNRDVHSIVWHIHGAESLADDRSRLIITSEDYASIYSDATRVTDALKAIVRMKHVMFLGYSFRDQDLLHLLAQVRNHALPGIPVFAFLSGGTHSDAQRYSEKYGIEVISYDVVNGDHSELSDILRFYSAFTVPTAIGIGHAEREDDPETASMIVQAALRNESSETSLDAALISSVIASFRDPRQALSLSDIGHADSVRRALDLGLIVVDEDQAVLSELAVTRMENGKAKLELIEDRFRRSLVHRADQSQKSYSSDEIDSISEASFGALKTLSLNRGMCLARQIDGPTAGSPRGMANLMSGVQDHLRSCATKRIAMGTVEILQGVLSEPSDIEREYLGLRVECYFGLHFLRIHPSQRTILNNLLSATTFVLDSSFLIPLMATDSPGHSSAKRLLDRLHQSRCRLITTTMLAEEVAEHAQWAFRLLEISGSKSDAVMNSIRGACGYRRNEFLDGYITSPSFGPNVPHHQYFDATLRSGTSLPQVTSLSLALEDLDIEVADLADLFPDDQRLILRRDSGAMEIERRRKENGSYTRPSQVDAEAEVVVIVDQLRRSRNSISPDAFFISNSRVVDNIQGYANRLTLSPALAHSLLDSVAPLSSIHPEEAFNQLLADLAGSGLHLVPRNALIRIYAPEVDSSRVSLKSLCNEHRNFLRRNAIDPDRAFQNVDPLDLPRMASSLGIRMVDQLQKRNEQLGNKLEETLSSLKSMSIETNEFNRWKKAKAEKRSKSKKAKRRAASKHGGHKRTR
ncbi:MAG: SIR2 family protein [Methanothrix sp.]|nr:SIR2 family protein [Methanothrix sp.]